MPRILLLALSLLTLLSLPCRAAWAADAVADDIIDSSLPAHWQAADKTLALNGSALRKVMFLKIYRAGLYLPAVEHDAAAILTADAPRVMVMRFLRDVSQSDICKAWREGLVANTPDASIALADQFGVLCSHMRDMPEGSEMVLSYAPGQGVSVVLDGRAAAVIPGKPFADALLACWIGPKPGPGKDFKKALLSGK